MAEKIIYFPPGSKEEDPLSVCAKWSDECECASREKALESWLELL